MLNAYYGGIAGLCFTASVLCVVGNDGWSHFYCSGELCIKYRLLESEFCHIDNFKASYKKEVPLEIVFRLPENNRCVLALNSRIQKDTLQLGRKFDLIYVQKGNFERDRSRFTRRRRSNDSQHRSTRTN